MKKFHIEVACAFLEDDFPPAKGYWSVYPYDVSDKSLKEANKEAINLAWIQFENHHLIKAWIHFSEEVVDRTPKLKGEDL